MQSYQSYLFTGCSKQTDDGNCGLQRRNFGRFIAREAVLDEEFFCVHALLNKKNSWLFFVTFPKSISDFLVPVSYCQWQTAAWLRAEAHWESVSYMKHVDAYKRKYAEQEIKRLSAVLARQEPFDSHKYVYIANVCVAKFARCQGIASNMIHLAADVANLEDNLPGQELYKKTGFKIVEAASSSLSKEQRILMSLDL